MAIEHQNQFISIKQMYVNPVGKGSSNVASRYSIRNSMNNMFVKNLQENRRHFMALPYQAEDGTIYFWVKVPSRNFKQNKIKYDAIFEIPPSDLPLQLRPCKFFVNSPSFIYTYAYVFNQENLLIDWLKQRLPGLCLTQAPVVRNPVESRGYELILYQALSYLIVGNCLNPIYINRYKQIFNAYTKLEMQSKVADVQQLVQIYNFAKYNNTERHRKEPNQTRVQAQKQAIRDFEHDSKKVEPKLPKGRILPKKPRAAITAKKAKRSIK